MVYYLETHCIRWEYRKRVYINTFFLFTEDTIAELGVTGDPEPIREITSLVHRTFRLTSERIMKHIYA